MLKKIIVFMFAAFFIFNCEKERIDANQIIAKSIEVSGGHIIKNSKMAFDFRDQHYYANRHSNGFLLARVSNKNGDSVVDLLSNLDFKRLVNDTLVNIADSLIPRYSASVNSVHYFSVLPYGLDGKAVNKTFLGTTNIRGKDYFKIKVTFNEEGGGEDFEDVFIYWIQKDTFLVDYLAYSYNEADGLGMRFREAFNERYINGVRFVDYNNYKPKTNEAALEQLDDLFNKNALSLLSKIVLENIEVTSAKQ